MHRNWYYVCPPHKYISGHLPNSTFSVDWHHKLMWYIINWGNKICKKKIKSGKDLPSYAHVIFVIENFSLTLLADRKSPDTALSNIFIFMIYDEIMRKLILK